MKMQQSGRVKPFAGKPPLTIGAGLPNLTPCNHLGFLVPLVMSVEELPAPDSAPPVKRWQFWKKAPKPKTFTISRTKLWFCARPGCGEQFGFAPSVPPSKPQAPPNQTVNEADRGDFKA